MTDEAIEIRGIEERIRQFQNLATDNPVMGQRIREAIKATLRIVQKQLQSEARTGLDMKSDPRKAYKAVRMAVYRKIFGGQVNILSKRKVGAMHFYARRQPEPAWRQPPEAVGTNHHDDELSGL